MVLTYSTDNIALQVVRLCGVYGHIYLCPFIGSLNICTGYRSSCPGMKRSGREAEQLLPPSSKVTNEWNYTS